MKKLVMAVLLACCCTGFAFGQSIDLRGIVKNNTGSAISGVVVKLLSNGATGTSDSQGKFQIKSTSVARFQAPELSFNSFDPVFISGKGVRFGQSLPGLVHLQIFDLSGRIKSDMKVQLGTGIWQLNPEKLNPGIYLGRLATSGGVQNFRFSIFNASAKSDITSLSSVNNQSVGLRKVAATVDSLQVVKANYLTKIVPLSSLVDSVLSITMDTATASSSQLPGDIAAAAGTPLVCAHSMVRAMYSTYSGKLFQVRRSSDGKTQDIMPTVAGGPANISALKTFLGSSAGTVSYLYDQAGNGNDLWQLTVNNQMDLQYWTSPAGASVAMAVTPKSEKWLRNRIKTKKIPVGAEPQSVYFVVYSKVYNSGCCFDYGNEQANDNPRPSSDNKAGMMNTVCIATTNNGYSFNTGAGSGPWGMDDFEGGVYSGYQRNKNNNNPSLTWPIATVSAKTNGTTNWKLQVGDVEKGTLVTAYDGLLPTTEYSPLRVQGGLSLGEGGDGASGAAGAFFEGAMIAAMSSDATDKSIQTGLTSYFK